MHEKKARLAAYSAAHFAVDFCCALLVFRVVGRCADPKALFLLYNYCAFALQMPIGLIADKWGRGAVMAALGCAVTGLAFAFTALPLMAVAVLGVGNALFHVGGGLDVLCDSGDRASALGVFVSPGAAGLFVGTMLGKGSAFPLWGALLSLAACYAVILLAERGARRGMRSDCAPFSLSGLSRPGRLIPIVCLFAVVVLRSYAGMTMQFAWKSQGYWGVAAMLAVVLGKCAGGLAMDRLGGMRAALASLGAAGVLFLIGDNPFAGTAAIFLFNMTMPITLFQVARHMSACKGFSFGLLTFGLFWGFVPMGLGLVQASSSPALLALCALSMLLMIPGLWQGKELAHAQ